jgi:deazaflavin-dependent oxidoreductase (nitroreductase family)
MEGTDLMTEQSTTGSAGTLPAGQAKTLAAQNLANRIVRGLLRTPLLNRAAGSRLVTLYVTGRKSGRRYTIPVAYTRHDGDLMIGTPFGWGRNLRTGEPLTIRLKGRLRQADVQVFTTEADVTRLYAIMTSENRTFAKFNKVSVDAAGRPDPGDLHRAWADGARVFLLTPR